MFKFFMSETWFIKFLGQNVMNGGIFDLHHDIFFLFILIFVFVSRMLVRALWHFHEQTNPILPKRIWNGIKIERISHGLVAIFIIWIAGVMGGAFAAECQPLTENEPGAASGSGSGTTGPSCTDVEERFFTFLKQWGKSSVRQTHFDNLREEFKLGSATLEGRAKLLALMEKISRNQDSISSRQDAGAQLVIEYSAWVQERYKKNLFRK